MSKPFEEPSLDSLVGVLRADVVKTDGATRERIHTRLATGVLAQLFGSALLPSFLQNGLVKSQAFAKTKAFAVAVALPVGVAIGASGHAWFANRHVAREPAAQRVIATLPPPAVVQSASVPPPVSVSEPAAPPEASTAPAARANPAAPVRNSWKALNRELSMLEKARTLLSAGHADETLALLAQHQRRYPYSALEQERQALYIKALVATDRMIEARTRAAFFVRSFPRSTLRGSVEKAVLPIP